MMDTLPNQPAIAFVVAACDEAVLRAALLASPDLAGAEISVQRNAPCAGAACNRGLEQTQAEVIVFAHQDVFLPAGWVGSLRESVNYLAANDPDRGIPGVYGVSKAGEWMGWTYSNGSGEALGQPFPTPRPVRVLDEMLLIVRRSANLRFDENLPGFHLYGTDICLEAEKRGMQNYIISYFAIHNSKGLLWLPSTFWRACLHLQKTRAAQLPVQATCAVLTHSRFAVLKEFFLDWLRAKYNPERFGTRVADPAALCRQVQSRMESLPCSTT